MRAAFLGPLTNFIVIGKDVAAVLAGSILLGARPPMSIAACATCATRRPSVPGCLRRGLRVPHLLLEANRDYRELLVLAFLFPKRLLNEIQGFFVAE